MKYGIDYRLLPKGATKLVDNTTMHRAVDVEVDEDGVRADPQCRRLRRLPRRGRHPPRAAQGQGSKSRCFNYKLGYCYVTIVIEESDDDWSCIKP